MGHPLQKEEVHYHETRIALLEQAMVNLDKRFDVMDKRLEKMDDKIDSHSSLICPFSSNFSILTARARTSDE